jgi:hypothetical protein
MSLTIEIGANINGVDKAVNDVTNNLKEIQPAADKASTAIAAVGKSIESIDNAAPAVENTAKAIKAVTDSASGLKKVSPEAQKAQNTLTGLSGVVRDLPFGFIAIQNNLPILAEQFTSLSKESGGVGGALKNLGGALVGPAGIAFAFGAVTSIVTSLIQEYGSLGEAINVILGITKPLTEAQKAYNKASNEAAGNIAAEEAKVKVLTKTLLDNKQPQKDRLAAYGELKKVAPDVVAGIKDENALTDASNILIAANTKLRAESVRLKVQEAGITAALTTNETKIAELRAKLDKVTQDYVKSAKELNTANKDNIVTGFGSVTAQESALTAFNNNAKAVKELQAQINVLTGENQTYLNQLDPVVLGIAKINEETRKQVEGLKESNKETKESIRNAKKKAEIDKKAFDQFLKQQAAKELARSQRVPLLVSFEIAEIGKQDFGAIYKKNIIDKFKKEQDRVGGIQVPINLPKVDPNAIAQGLLNAQKQTEAFKQNILKQANLQAATDLFKETFFNPVQNLFSDLISGADGAFKAFTKAVLQAINQIVAKIIATGIISLLANLISGGTAGLGKAVFKDIIGALGFGIGKVANPNFGGVGAGGMQMSGAVNVVLRGQDLVGALNRTNSQINRVG